MTLDMGGLASGPDPHAMAAVHQWRASLLSNLINPNYQLFSQHSDGIFKIPAPHSPLRVEFPHPGIAPRLPVRAGLGGRRRAAPGDAGSSDQLQRVSSLRETGILTTRSQSRGSCQHPHWPHTSGRRWRMNLEARISTLNKRAMWMFGTQS